MMNFKTTGSIRIFLLTLFAGILMSLFSTVSAAEAPETKTDENIAVVNKVPITKKDFEEELNRYQSQMAMRGQPVSPDELNDLKTLAVQNLIGQELIIQECKKLKIKIDEKDVEEQIGKFRDHFKTDDEFQKALSENQVTEKELRDKVERRLIAQKFIDTRISDKLTVTDSESKTFYDSHPEYFAQPAKIKASHILVKMSPDADDTTKAEARKKIKAVQEKLKKGEDFAELAKTHSEGPSNVQGGDLGYFSKGQMVKPFEDAAFAMKTGEISDVVETQFGLHLIKLTDKQEEGKTPYKDVKEKITEFLKQEKIGSELTAYIENLKKTAVIENHLQL